ncbi:MAG: PD40 domain-containing protein, partial [Thermoleophilia bacterium]|nr:PD40 domain-containing protein [Thermoleophilia bacterium]
TLIDNPADDSAPRWSPGGGHIVFKSNRHGDWAIWGVAVKDARPAGAPFMIMAGARDFQLSNWRPVGLVLTRVISSADVYKMPVDLSTGKALGKPEPLRYTPTGSNYLPVWSSDGQQIAFIKQNREKREIAVVITSADGSKSQEFVLPPKCGGGFLRWTPDSKAIGFAGIDSTQKSTLFRLTPATRVWEKWPLGMAGFSRMEWSKDGNSFYYFDNGQGGSEYGIFKRTVGENEGSNIYDPEYKEGSFRDIRCSRDYSRLAFWENGAIYIMDLATGMLQRITAERDTSDLDVSDINYGSPSWSPDGKRIMVPKANIDAKMNEKHEIHVFDLETGYSEIVDLGKSL